MAASNAPKGDVCSSVKHISNERFHIKVCLSPMFPLTSHKFLLRKQKGWIDGAIKHQLRPRDENSFSLYGLHSGNII